jgi:NAD(P)-dependent dehydrogenase (short-subunit alcohol dehydrogenase family)
MDSLRDKTAVITGASSGMGLAVAHAFAHRGANLASGARREGPLAQAARECEAKGVGAVWVHADVTNAEVGLCSPGLPNHAAPTVSEASQIRSVCP